MPYLDASLPPGRAMRLIILGVALLAIPGACSTSAESDEALTTLDESLTDPTGDPTTTDTDPDSNTDSDTDSDSDSDPPDEPPPDVGELATSCDPWAPDCAEDEKCSWQLVDSVHLSLCLPLSPEPKLPGETCEVYGGPGSGYDDCALGSICSWVNEQDAGVCLALCSGTPETPSCEQDPNNEGEISSVCALCPDCPSLCLEICSPLVDSCSPGYVCKPNAGTFTCTPATTVGPGQLGDPCQYSVQCAADFACIDSALVPGCEGAGCCSPFCELDEPECPEAMNCVIWAGDGPPPPGPSIGVCMAS